MDEELRPQFDGRVPVFSRNVRLAGPEGQGLQARLAAVGRMAFTNYLLQTVLCTTIFYGHGLGLYVERVQQLLIVFAVWVFQLWLSPVWLRRYSYGPLEWLWRTLTYGRLRPRGA